MLTHFEKEKLYKEIATEVYFGIGKLKNAFPHGSPEWKEFTKMKKELRKKLWEFFITDRNS